MSVDFKTNFSRGQLSAKVETRIDAKAYHDGAREVTNMLCYLQGGVSTRPGSKNRARLDNAGVPIPPTYGARLETWMFDRDEVYLLAFTDGRVDIWRVTTSGVTLSDEITGQDWDGFSMWYMVVKPAGNICVVTDNGFWPLVITRTALDSFSASPMAFDERADGDESFEPFARYAAREVTLAISSYATGSGRTVTASADVFDLSHVGRRFRMRGGEFEVTSYSSATSVTATVLREIRVILDPNPFATHDGDTLITCTWAGHGLTAGDTVNFSGAGDAPGATIVGTDINGNRTVNEVLDEDRFTFTAGASATETVDFGGSDVWARSGSATRDWFEPAFSELRGYPQACEFHEGRLWLAGVPSAPATRWASRPGAIFDFGLGDGGPADAIRATGATGGNIRHMVSGEDLEIYTDFAEAYMPSGIDEPITPANLREKRQTRYGASYTSPQRFDGSTIFVDAVGQHVREFLYSDTTDVYTASPVTALAPEVINLPRHSALFDGADSDSTPYAIFTNTDGSAAFFHSARQENIAGWTAQNTEGTYLSFAGAGERLFALVTRGSAMYLEEWDWNYVARADGCENLTHAGTTAWQVTMAYLKDTTVHVFRADGTVLGAKTTDASGNFTTTASETDIWVGLPASWALETMSPAIGGYSEGTPTSTILGDRVLIKNAVAFLKDTDRIKLGLTEKSFATPKTGAVQFRVRGWQRQPTLPVSGHIAYRATVSGIRAEVI